MLLEGLATLTGQVAGNLADPIALIGYVVIGLKFPGRYWTALFVACAWALAMEALALATKPAYDDFAFGDALAPKLLGAMLIASMAYAAAKGVRRVRRWRASRRAARLSKAHELKQSRSAPRSKRDGSPAQPQSAERWKTITEMRVDKLRAETARLDLDDLEDLARNSQGHEQYSKTGMTPKEWGAGIAALVKERRARAV